MKNNDVPLSSSENARENAICVFIRSNADITSCIPPLSVKYFPYLYIVLLYPCIFIFVLVLTCNAKIKFFLRITIFSKIFLHPIKLTF